MRRYLKPIYNFVRQYLRAEDDAEDASQDIFFKVWKYAGRFKHGKRFKPWLYTIARNTALDHIKKRRASAFSELDDVENGLEFEDTLKDEEPLPDEIFESVESSAMLDTLLDTLHPDHRTVLILHYREEMTFNEIAIVMKKPMNTVKSWHRRALGKIRKVMSETGAYPRTK